MSTRHKAQETAKQMSDDGGCKFDPMGECSVFANGQSGIGYLNLLWDPIPEVEEYIEIDW